MDEKELMDYVTSEFGEDGATAIVESATKQSKIVSASEVAQHNRPDDCWMVLHGMVYDLTDFAKGHLGGSQLITNLAGTDGTQAFSRVHRESILRGLDARYQIGQLDVNSHWPTSSSQRQCPAARVSHSVQAPARPASPPQAPPLPVKPAVPSIPAPPRKR
eukprot:TRINITY_DN30263_c0_g1_i1.p1 TRINITY_DN30263_c0_g1~~TRINITY_DN30263_c0_g1_i1.p1  ORF type:complete len:161 (-),score=13.93 TRINITY_DN30263_c0_g1_i1:244-726(-)